MYLVIRTKDTVPSWVSNNYGLPDAGKEIILNNCDDDYLGEWFYKIKDVIPFMKEQYHFNNIVEAFYTESLIYKSNGKDSFFHLTSETFHPDKTYGVFTLLGIKRIISEGYFNKEHLKELQELFSTTTIEYLLERPRSGNGLLGFVDFYLNRLNVFHHKINKNPKYFKDINDPLEHLRKSLDKTRDVQDMKLTKTISKNSFTTNKTFY